MHRGGSGTGGGVRTLGRSLAPASTDTGPARIPMPAPPSPSAAAPDERRGRETPNPHLQAKGVKLCSDHGAAACPPSLQTATRISSGVGRSAHCVEQAPGGRGVGRWVKKAIMQGWRAKCVSGERARRHSSKGQALPGLAGSSQARGPQLPAQPQRTRSPRARGVGVGGPCTEGGSSPWRAAQQCALRLSGVLGALSSAESFPARNEQCHYPDTNRTRPKQLHCARLCSRINRFFPS